VGFFEYRTVPKAWKKWTDGVDVRTTRCTTALPYTPATNCTQVPWPTFPVATRSYTKSRCGPNDWTSSNWTVCIRPPARPMQSNITQTASMTALYIYKFFYRPEFREFAGIQGLHIFLLQRNRRRVHKLRKSK